MISDNLSNSDKWVVLKSLFDEKGLVRQHLDSYNNFIQLEMQEIVDESGEVIPDIPGFKIKFGKINEDKIREILVKEHDFSDTRVDKQLERLREAHEKSKQKGLDKWVS